MKKKIIWSINFFVLGLFTIYSLTGIFGGGVNKAYAETLSKDGFYKHGKKFMVVDKHESKTGFRAGVEGDQEICMLSTEQVAELDAFFNVQTFNLQVQEDTVTIASVSGRRLTKQQLLDYLRASDSNLDCRIIQHQRVFFMPVLPQVS
jgi:hypothetical protein